MKLFGWEISRARTKSGLDPALWLRGEDVGENEGAKLLSPYSQSAWVYIAVSVLAENVAQIPFRISRMPGSAERDFDRINRIDRISGKVRSNSRSMLRRALGENIVEKGAVVELFERPHPTMDRSLFWEMLMTWRALRGEFFVLPLDEEDQPVDLGGIRGRGRGGGRGGVEVRRLITLAPDNFWHMVQGYDLAGWRFTGAPMMSPIASQVLLPSEVIHSRAPNPYLYWRGLSPLVVAMLPAAADYAAEQFMKGLMLNNADTGLLITMMKQPTDEQRAHVLAALRERKRSAGTADRPLFLWGGARVEKPQVSSADLQFLENRKLNRQEIAAIFKVPESMMGFTETRGQLGGGGGSSIEADKLTFVQNTLTNHCRRLESALDPVVKSFGRDLYGWFDIEGLPILQEARRQRLDAAVKAFGMGVPFNEVNHVFDLGFKALPWGDKGYLPANLQETGELPTADDHQGANIASPSPGGEGRGLSRHSVLATADEGERFADSLSRLTRLLQHHIP